jgi:hypothetical protein
MRSEPSRRPLLAPLQCRMLQDSQLDGESGHHVEQVEIVFAPGPMRQRVAAAWRETVDRTEALQIAFLMDSDGRWSWKWVSPERNLNHLEPMPESWEFWLERDRCLPLLGPHQVPWRAAYGPQEGRFIWTFHHALLDGRSITRVLGDFLERVSGNEVSGLAIAEWHSPTAEALVRAAEIFLDDFSDMERFSPKFPESISETETAVRWLGQGAVSRLESLAVAMEISTAAALTWTWGQALANASGVAAVMVEQLRAGAPQPGTAGFTMNTLPVRISRAGADEAQASLRAFRIRLLELRAVESVSCKDFPPGIFPNMDVPSTSVIMVERGTFRHLAGRVANSGIVESLTLHEPKGESLMATAHILPDLRLAVEGPGARGLLARWIAEIEQLVAGLSHLKSL